MERFEKQFQNCRQWEKPFCTAACPFHVDVLDFQDKMKRNNYNSAYKTFRNAVAFPDIVAALCPSYCGGSCPDGGRNLDVQLNLLEKTCVAKATRKDPTDYNVPAKNRKVGIIGAGISGLACAHRLASKKYDVTVYEKSDKIGGMLWNILPQEIFFADIERQFKYENYALHLNTEVKNIEDLKDQGFEAIYVATGKDGEDFGLTEKDGAPCMVIGETAVFAGGSLRGKDPVKALVDGLDMAWAIEVYLKTKRLEYPQEGPPSKVVVDPDKWITAPQVTPTDNGIFTDEEAAAEAERCVRCQCDACRIYCDLTDFYNKWPLKIRDEVIATISPSDSLLHGTPGRRLINTCTECGLCDLTCPENIELGGMIHEARKRLHKLDKMPGAYHQYWMADMNFADGPYASLRKHAPGKDKSNYAFFPGCQLGATDPRYVTESYDWLLSKNPETGLLLRCCGVPAEWAGNEEAHQQKLDDIRKDWEEMGKPVLIMACPTCNKKLKEFLPEVETISLYEILADWGGSEEWKKVATDKKGKTYSVFDACSAREAEDTRQAVRELAKKAGVEQKELPKNKRNGCCGYGGHGSVANPDFAEYVAKKKSALGEEPYITYCVNCRDIFREEGKPVLHILDLLFDINDEAGDLPDVTERRDHRIQLKEELLDKFWGETMKEKPEKSDLKLIISSEIREKMNRQKVLEEDVANVVEFCESLGRRIYQPDKGTYTCFRELGYITYWVEYRLLETGEYEIVNVYTHRIKMELEMMWNGRKTDFDLR